MTDELSESLPACLLLCLFTQAARRVGDVPSNVTVHYVSQEVHVSEATEAMLPGQCVVAADVERRLLLEEEASLEALADSDNLDAEGAGVSGKKESLNATPPSLQPSIVAVLEYAACARCLLDIAMDRCSAMDRCALAVLSFM